MKQVIFVIMAIALMGCGSGPNNIPDGVTPFYAEFVADANARGWDMDYNESITVEYGDLGSGKIGDCAEVEGKPTITVGSKFWDSAKDDAKKVLIYHELGHCLLKRNHSQDKNSIMFPSLVPSLEAYNAHPSDSINELFAK